MAVKRQILHKIVTMFDIISSHITILKFLAQFLNFLIANRKTVGWVYEFIIDVIFCDESKSLFLDTLY